MYKGTFRLYFGLKHTYKVVRLISGKLLGEYGEVFIILLALCITILAMVVLTISNGLTSVIVATALYGVWFGSTQPALQVAMLTIVDPSKRGVANATFFTAFDLGIGLGANLLGAVS